MGRLSGKVAIITASTDGIGFAFAKRLLTEGAKVVVSSRNQKNVNAAVENLKKIDQQNVCGVVCDVTNAEHRRKICEEAVNKFGGIDILISNAASDIAAGVTIDKCSEELWDTTFDVNVKSAFLLTKEVLPYLQERNGGSIIYISSIAGLRPFPKLFGAYGVSKTALIGMNRAFAEELASYNIRVNCIAPGLTRTKFVREITENEASYNAFISEVPLKRIGETSDIEGVAAFLCSEDANYITGETIVVAGGMRGRF